MFTNKAGLRYGETLELGFSLANSSRDDPNGFAETCLKYDEHETI
jgi:hypothetical protein